MIVKDLQRHPVRDEAVHVDLLRVDSRGDRVARSSLELTGADEAPGVVEGGILSQDTRELAIEALPGDSRTSIRHDVSGMQMNETETLASGHPARRGDAARRPEETVIATVTPPTLEPMEEEIETETEVVGEAGEAEGRGGPPRAAEGEAGAERRRPSDSRRVLSSFFGSTPVDWLVVGLGNPGPGYAETPAQRRLQGRRGARPRAGTCRSPRRSSPAS